VAERLLYSELRNTKGGKLRVKPLSWRSQAGEKDSGVVLQAKRKPLLRGAQAQSKRNARQEISPTNEEKKDAGRALRKRGMGQASKRRIARRHRQVYPPQQDQKRRAGGPKGKPVRQKRKAKSKIPKPKAAANPGRGFFSLAQKEQKSSHLSY